MMIKCLSDTIKSRLSSGFHLSPPSMERIQSNIKSPCPSRQIWGAAWHGTSRWDSETFWNSWGLQWLRQEMSLELDSSRLIESYEWDKLGRRTPNRPVYIGPVCPDTTSGCEQEGRTLLYERGMQRQNHSVTLLWLKRGRWRLSVRSWQLFIAP